MSRLLNTLFQFAHLDPRIYDLEKEIDYHRYIIFAALFVIFALLLIIILQRRLFMGRIKGDAAQPTAEAVDTRSADTEAREVPAPGRVPPHDLLDPGLVFKYSLAGKDAAEKSITIGRSAGSIRTHSTEIVDNHLIVAIRVAGRGQPSAGGGEAIREYEIELRREGWVQLWHPGLEGFREMDARERISMGHGPDGTGNPAFESLDAKRPLRLRLGDGPDPAGRFKGGYFEFHLFTRDYMAGTGNEEGTPVIEKYFLIRLYKIYPGYDTSSPTDDGAYPMVAPFTAG